ncbi:DUF3187 family protein [Litoribrevibacter albus]|uniref:DUF3187 family protein n=1 Tax=Litoribrevibacter albus TaxID=1473156 RepID=A0AA37S6G5_9GAMM|nr:DUF3187 family protein [Litoribrevibacter albus]GLQ29782.1 hypothetical protein GCM10007876_02600 [Litoribrevibacter albus]
MIRMRKIPYLVSLLSCTALASICQGADLNPINSRFSSPIEGLFNIPGMSEIQLLSSGQQKAGVKAEVVSNAVTMNDGAEIVRFDGETWRLTPTWSMGFDDGWQVSAELPLIRHSSGFLDNAIDKWHEIFNFREGSRDDFPRNELVYGYQNDNSVDYLITSSENGVGDLRLQLSKSFADELPFVLHFYLKAPTGDEDKLMGSGSWDLGTSLSYIKPQLFDIESLSLAAEVGQHYLGETDQVRNQKQHLTTLHAGLFWEAFSGFTLKSQLESHSKLAESSVEPAESEALQLTLGASITAMESQQWDIAFSEDVKTDSTADVTFFVEWSYRY